MNKKIENKPIRLNKYLAHSGLGDRRKCDEFIKQGLVSVNGDIIIEPGVKVMISDEVLYKNEIVKPEKKVYILINKAKNMDFDNESELSVSDLIKSFPEKLNLGYTPEVLPIDNLNRDQLGLMVITNDETISRQKVSSVFQIHLNKEFKELDRKKMLKGFILNDKDFKLEEIQFIDEENDNLGIRTNCHNAQEINDAFNHLSYHIDRLDRTIISGLSKRDLPRGKWRFLKPNEIIKLKHLKY